jgi:hypothetical protein
MVTMILWVLAQGMFPASGLNFTLKIGTVRFSEKLASTDG